jgi:hypothetical protein
MLLELLTKRNEIDLYWHTNLVYVNQVAFVYLETRRAHKLINMNFDGNILDISNHRYMYRRFVSLYKNHSHRQ